MAAVARDADADDNSRRRVHSSEDEEEGGRRRRSRSMEACDGAILAFAGWGLVCVCVIDEVSCQSAKLDFNNARRWKKENHDTHARSLWTTYRRAATIPWLENPRWFG